MQTLSLQYYPSRCEKLLFYESLLFEMGAILILRVTLRDGGNSSSTNHYSSRWNPNLCAITLRGGGNSNCTNQYFSRWRKLQFYESLLFEVEGIPILRITNAPVTMCCGGGTELIPRREGAGAGSLASNLPRTSITTQMEETSIYGSLFEIEGAPILRITRRGGEDSNSTSHYSSGWRKTFFCESLFEMEETPILRITPRGGGKPHSTNHFSRWRKLPFYESLFEVEEVPILRIIIV